MKRLVLSGVLFLSVFFTAMAQKYEPAAELKFNENGTFKILQLADTHYIADDTLSLRALNCVEEMLDTEKPDFVIHTGDIIFGAPAERGVQELFAPLVKRGIPFAVTLGNHDGQFDLNRYEIYEAVRRIPGCVNRPAEEKGITGHSNDYLTLSSADSLEFVFYLLDSGDRYERVEDSRKCYDFIRFDQIEWYRHLSLSFREANGDKPVQSVAFFHIPLPEIASLQKHRSTIVYGNSEEAPCPSKINSGLYAQFRELEDVFAVTNGHDHDCDYVVVRGPVTMMYGRYSGGNTVYNHLGLEGRSDNKVSGARVFEFRSGEKGLTTWIRLVGGAIQHPLRITSESVTPLNQ